MRRLSLELLFVLAVAVVVVPAQVRDHQIHSRGMLRQTVFNTGEIGRAYDQGAGGSSSFQPSFEWPANSATTVDGIPYNGQFNSFGGGLYLACNRKDSVDRLYAFCGGLVGEPTDGRYSFPITLERHENYPVLADGSLNPGYNPDEAEEVIVAKWATNLGLTITRTSRQWSNPDYDDFIIHEYEVENTGIVDKSGVPAFHDTLWDVLVNFAYALNPSMFGYERTFNRWDGADFTAIDLYPRFNANRWLNYCVDRNGKPESRYFDEWASTGKNGGGLLSPQAVGFLPLYYNTDHLATLAQTKMVISTSDQATVLDGLTRLKQPFLNRMETGNLTSSKMKPYFDVTQARKNNPYRSAYYPYRTSYWIGRGSYNWRQSNKFGIGHIMSFGPYLMEPGAKIRFAVAEVAGYGASRYGETGPDAVDKDTTMRWDEGGSCGELCGEGSDVASNAFNPVPSWYKAITWGGVNHNAWTQGSDYLSHYPLPPYVNSSVVTVREVADRAIQCYTGARLRQYDGYADSVQYKPENSADHGSYLIPVTVPAPAFTVESNRLAQNVITWGPQVELFTASRLRAPFSYYEVSKANSPLGPWTLIDTVTAGDPRVFQGGVYSVIDTSTQVTEAYYYSVISVDQSGNKSGRTQITLHKTIIPATAELIQPYATPNPFIVTNAFGGVSASTGSVDPLSIRFRSLPAKCTIRIFSYSGQLLDTIEKDSPEDDASWSQITRNDQLIASGLYFFVVDSPDGKQYHGKFVVIK
jgi:hypothetical protein